MFLFWAFVGWYSIMDSSLLSYVAKLGQLIEIKKIIGEKYVKTMAVVTRSVCVAGLLPLGVF